MLLKGAFLVVNIAGKNDLIMRIFRIFAFSFLLAACSAQVDVVYYHPDNSDLDSLISRNPKILEKHHAFISKIAQELPLLEANGKRCVITTKQVADVSVNIDSLIDVHQFGMLIRNARGWEMPDSNHSLLQHLH